jgi:hypothetical protein
MFISREFIKKNINKFSILLYIFLFSLFVWFKPNFLYNKDGSLREFGIGTRYKTVIPLWLLSLILAIVSYFLTLYYIISPKLLI